MVTADVYHEPIARPADEDGLRIAAREMFVACEPCGAAEAERLLMALRSSTRPTNESAAEAEVSFRVIVRECAKVPADLVRAAASRHIAKAGTAFFPRSPGEFLQHVAKELRNRPIMALRFEQMANSARDAAIEQRRLDEPVDWTPDAIRDLGRFASAGVTNGWFTQAALDEAFAETATNTG